MVLAMYMLVAINFCEMKFSVSQRPGLQEDKINCTKLVHKCIVATGKDKMEECLK